MNPFCCHFALKKKRIIQSHHFKIQIQDINETVLILEITSKKTADQRNFECTNCKYANDI